MDSKEQAGNEKKNQVPVWKKLIDSPTEVVSAVGVVIIVALGFAGKIEGAWLAGSLVALLYLWVGVRVSKVGPGGLTIKDDDESPD